MKKDKYKKSAESFLLRNNRSLTAIPVIIFILAIAFAISLRYENEARFTQQSNRLVTEANLKADQHVELIEEYFNSIYALLYTVSIDDEIVAMTKDSREYIKNIMAVRTGHHIFSELCVIERDFDGTKEPFMVFESDTCEFEVDTSFNLEPHSLESELDEYVIQQSHIKGFIENPNQQSILSPPVLLCLGVKGIIYSVPIISDTGLVGIVSGMIPLSWISASLEYGNYHAMSFMVSDEGTVITCEDFSQEDLGLFISKFDVEGIEHYFASSPKSFYSEKWLTSWKPMKLITNQQWWLFYQLDSEFYLGNKSFYKIWGFPLSIVILGLLVALLVEVIRRRFMDAVIYMNLQDETDQKLIDLAVFPEQNPNVVIKIGSSGDVQYANPAADELVHELGGRKSDYHRVVSGSLIRASWKCIKTRQNIKALAIALEDRILEWSIYPIPHTNAVYCYASDITQRQRAEEERELLSREKDNRVREIKCLYGVSNILDSPQFSLFEAMTEAVKQIPQGWQFPEITCASISLDGTDYESEVFDRTDWKISSDIMTGGKLAGSVAVYYLQEKPRRDEGPFRVQERNLIDGLAALISRYVERAKFEEELKMMSVAVTQSANMVTIADPDGIIEYVNPRFTDVTGFKLLEAVGKTSRILSSGQQSDEVYKNLWETIKSGKTWTGHLQNKTRSGDLYWERKTITPILDASGKTIHFLSLGEDITAERLMQQKLSEADKFSAVGTLAAGVAHEFKNYLCGIIGNASFGLELLDDPDSISSIKEILTQVIEQGEKANEIAMSLLTYSKSRPEDFSTAEMSEVIRRTVKLVDKEMKNQGIELVLHFEEVPKIKMSASKIQQLLLNLLINAQHAIGFNGVVTVTLAQSDDMAVVKVSDSGSGIPKDNLKKIFDPFFSTKGVWGKDEVVGTGMGLAICRNIAREHGGDLSVESKVGVGTVFTLILPSKEEVDTLDIAEQYRQQSSSAILFSLEVDVLNQIIKDSDEVGLTIVQYDSIDMIGVEILTSSDFVICDARFPGKGELWRLVELCRKHRVPYLTINGGMMEYQLAEMFEGAISNFKETPTSVALRDVFSLVEKNSIS